MILANIENKITKDAILFFDMDGTLIDTDFANFLSYKMAIQSVTNAGMHLTYCPEQRFNRTVLLEVLPDLTKSDYKKIIQAKERFYSDFLSETKIINEVAHFLFKYSTTNQSVLVTNCRENRVTTTLDYHGLTNKFSKIYSRQLTDTGQRINKYNSAIADLKIFPVNIIVFENERTEIADAIKAGIPSDNIVELINFKN